MNALTTGALIILYIVMSQSIAAYIVSQTEPDTGVAGCETITLHANNTTTCSGSGPSFINYVLDVSISGIDGAPSWFNALWVIFHAILLVLALTLIVAYFIGLFFGDAA